MKVRIERFSHACLFCKKNARMTRITGEGFVIVKWHCIHCSHRYKIEAAIARKKETR